ncbi:DeoR/GlpR family DNA-binding transcription regulator [Amnibacterium sp. CER49]|nr:DeoR/GlpR family DNA-binding transcription regulator [Amnibacterium sp. CER49]MDH2443313.1 DeoR/GlpR family DNA-binding transcription regulator [Amnibacterium sp. CER49]
MILEQLSRRGEVTIGALSSHLEVSEMTIRRDLNQLAAAGLLIRTHGGATATVSGSFEPPFAVRARANSEAKRQIAGAVADQIRDGQTIILDGGTTGLAVARALVGRAITVCALNITIAALLADDATTRVMVPGGVVRTGEHSLIGSEAEAAFRGYRFDLFVMTASAASVAGFTEWNAEDAAVKRAALAASRRTIVAIDAAKFGNEAFSRICALDEVDLVVTDDQLQLDDRSQLDQAGIELLIA